MIFSAVLLYLLVKGLWQYSKFCGTGTYVCYWTVLCRPFSGYNLFGLLEKLFGVVNIYCSHFNDSVFYWIRNPLIGVFIVFNTEKE